MFCDVVVAGSERARQPRGGVGWGERPVALCANCMFARQGVRKSKKKQKGKVCRAYDDGKDKKMRKEGVAAALGNKKKKNERTVP